jgi:hypothetical protein
VILAARTSDHSPILVNFFTCHRKGQGQGLPGRGFKFEASWLNDVECGEVINTAWNNGPSDVSSFEGIQSRLSACRRALLNWSGQKYGKVEEDIKRKTS